MSKRISTGIRSTVRHRRLEIRRMRSVTSTSTTTTAAIKNSSTENDGGVGNHFAVPDDVCIVKRRRAITDVTSSESTSTASKKSKIDIGESKSEMTLSGSSSSSSSQNEGVPLGILVSGGEFSGENESRSLTCVSHGSISVIGRRRQMEDTVTVALGIFAGEFTSYDFFAVYDGHGGSQVSRACRDRMHQLLAKEVEKWTRGGGEGGRVDWEIAMAACFKKMDDEVSVGGGDGDEVAGVTLTSVATMGSTSVATMGSTAVVVVVGKNEIVVANCGDSRAVLYRSGVPVPLSCDHKPDRPDERERVEAAGGDQYLKPYVISEPEVTVNERTEADGFIIVASDGLWDVLSNEVACEVVRRCLGGQVKRRFAEEVNGSYSMEAAAMLAELAMARGSKDNISVIVVELKRLLESPF